MFWQFNFCMQFSFWAFQALRKFVYTHKHAHTHTHTGGCCVASIFYFISFFAFVQLCNNHFCTANSFPFALVSLWVCVWVCVQQSPANFVRFIRIRAVQQRCILFGSSGYPEMNFHGNFIKARAPPSLYLFPAACHVARNADFNLRHRAPPSPSSCAA